MFGSNYLIVVNNIRDRARTPNYIAVNTLVPLLATPVHSGGHRRADPAGNRPRGCRRLRPGGGGRDIGSTSDQFQYFYQAQSGNFDVKVRLEIIVPNRPVSRRRV